MDIVSTGNMLPAMSKEKLLEVAGLEQCVNAMPQIDIPTSHVLHGGVYSRTIKMNAGTVLVGALIKVPTTLVINGNVTVFIGEESINVEGYYVVPAEAGRKQAFYAWSDTYLTMIFATDCKTVSDCEMEFTDEYEKLISRREGSINTFNITGG